MVRIGFIVMTATCAAACSGEITSIGAEVDPDATVEEPSLAIESPAEGSTFVRESLDPLGALVAVVDVDVSAGGPIERVEIYAGDQLVADGMIAALQLAVDGPATIRAVGYDADGDAVADDEVAIAVAAPQPADCYAWLDLYQLDYTLGPDNQGVDQPVTVTAPINGMQYRYYYNEDPREGFFMHCELALSLARAAPLMRERDIVEVLDIGVYNYRCIGGGDPPDCPNGISQHAYAKAIDIAGFTTSDDVFYSVNDDWVIDGDGEATCTAPTESNADAFLHETICALKHGGVWNIVLTPNYNDAHRNHFHVDLTTGSDYIRRMLDGTGVPALSSGGTCAL